MAFIYTGKHGVGGTVPSGAIVPYDSDGSIPNGWTQWTGAGYNFIVANKNTAGATGGSSTFTTNASSTAGSHAAPATAAIYASTGVNNPYVGDSAAGGHTHTLTLDLATPIRRVYFRFIKANFSQDYFPPGALVMATSTLGEGATVSQVYDGASKFLQADSFGRGSSTDGEVYTSGVESTAGAHAHGAQARTNSTFASHAVIGDHANHTLSAASFSSVLPSIYVTAWTNASDYFTAVSGMIAMWESSTPPDGWAICDGASGTVNLSSHFIEFGTLANQGTDPGGTSTNNITYGVTLDSRAWSHNHTGALGPNPGAGTYTGTHGSAHSHKIASATYSAVPPWYTLIFIQKI